MVVSSSDYELARQGAWDELEARTPHPALLERAGALVRHVRQVDLSEFQAGLTELLREAARRARRDASVRALYWKIDPGNGWTNAVFLATSYLPDLDWYGASHRTVAGPACPFAALWEELSLDERFDVEEVATQRASACFGRAFDAASPLGYPVAFGQHDMPPLYAPLPPGAMSLDQVPRVVVIAVEPGCWYSLSPLGADDRAHPHARREPMAASSPVEMMRWYRQEGPAPDTLPDLRLRGGGLEDLLVTDSFPGWVASTRFTEVLQRSAAPGDQVEVVPRGLVSDDGSRHTYFHIKVSSGPRPVDVSPERFHQVAEGRHRPVFTQEALDRRHVVYPTANYFITPSLVAVVSSRCLTALQQAGAVTGVRAREIVVLAEADMP